MTLKKMQVGYGQVPVVEKASKPWGLGEGILIGLSLGLLIGGYVIWHWLVK